LAGGVAGEALVGLDPNRWWFTTLLKAALGPQTRTSADSLFPTDLASGLRIREELSEILQDMSTGYLADHPLVSLD